MSIVNINETRDTQAEADTRKEELLRCWHPAGYGTSLRVYQDPTTGKWVVAGYRYSSCD